MVIETVVDIGWEAFTHLSITLCGRAVLELLQSKFVVYDVVQVTLKVTPDVSLSINTIWESFCWKLNVEFTILASIVVSIICDSRVNVEFQDALRGKFPLALNDMV